MPTRSMGTMKGIQTPIVPMLQRGNALGNAPRHRSALRTQSMGTIGVCGYLAFLTLRVCIIRS